MLNSEEQTMKEMYQQSLTNNVLRNHIIQDAAEYIRKATNWQKAQGFDFEFKYNANGIARLSIVNEKHVVNTHELMIHMKVYNEVLAKALIIADYNNDNVVADELSHVIAPDDYVTGQVVHVENEDGFYFIVSPAHLHFESDDEVVLDKYRDGNLVDTDLVYPKVVACIVEDTHACY